MLNGTLTRWELLRDDNFKTFFKELQEHLKKNLTYAPLEDGSDYWVIDFDWLLFSEGWLPDEDPFKYARKFTEDRKFDWWEVREMISEHLGEWVLDEAEIVNGYDWKAPNTPL